MALFVYQGVASAQGATPGDAIGVQGTTAEGQELIYFNANDPGTVTTGPTIVNVNFGALIVGLDLRPATGQVIGLTSDGIIVEIDARTGGVTNLQGFDRITGLDLFAGGVAVDVNPDADALRIIAGAENRRIPFTGENAGTVIEDGDLDYPEGGDNAGETPNVRAAGYTESGNIAGSPATALYDIDVDLDILAQQTPANAGTLDTIGNLGVDVDGRSANFDILDEGGADATGTLIYGTADTTQTVASVDLATGTATPNGTPLAAERGIVGFTFIQPGTNPLGDDGDPPDPTMCTVTGTDGNDTLVGTPGNDVICGFGGDDEINGLGGDDTIYAGAGDDTVAGGIGNDSIFGGSGNDTILGGDGADILRGQSGDDTILGGDGDDFVSGGDGADLMFGGAGADVLNGGAGNDRLRGGEGDDRLVGALGDDDLRGQDGDDDLRGQGGNDLILGGAGSDVGLGGAGIDTLAGQTGADRMFGESGNDLINVRDQAPGDLANGGAGNLDRCATDPGDRRVSCER